MLTNNIHLPVELHPACRNGAYLVAQTHLEWWFMWQTVFFEILQEEACVQLWEGFHINSRVVGHHSALVHSRNLISHL